MSTLAAAVADAGARIHFVGVAGSGMSALATWRARSGACASGSDRLFDSGLGGETAAALRAIGVTLTPQDGSSVEGAGLVVASSAVEAAIPDLARARSAGVPIVHRSELLAEHVAANVSVGITGTSGKSTVTALIFQLLRALDHDPGLITGGPLIALQDADGPGNAWQADGPLVFEADESDGSIVRYAPQAALVLNLQRDHAEPAEVLGRYATFLDNARGPRICGDGDELLSLRGGALVFGWSPDAALRGTDLEVGAGSSRFRLDGTPVHVPLPGAHNAWNTLAALAACRALEIPVSEAAEALVGCTGVVRRFQTVGEARGVTVIDDFAHNPAKIRASVACARLHGRRIHVFFQPHGFAPLAFVRPDLVTTLCEAPGPEDTVTLAPVLYLGGTAGGGITSDDVVRDLEARGRSARVVSKQEWPAAAARTARPGDVVLVMGARDPDLPQTARDILGALGLAD